MAEKYRYHIGLSLKETENLIERKSREEGFHVEFASKEIFIWKTKIWFGIEYTGRQSSLIAKLREDKNNTIIDGKFDFRKSIYVIAVIFWILFTLSGWWTLGWDTDPKIVSVLLMWGLIIMPIIRPNRHFYRKEKDMILGLLESIAIEHPAKKRI